MKQFIGLGIPDLGAFVLDLFLVFAAVDGCFFSSSVFLSEPVEGMDA